MCVTNWKWEKWYIEDFEEGFKWRTLTFVRDIKCNQVPIAQWLDNNKKVYN